MILIAPDKFKGTLSSVEAARIIAESLPTGTRYITAPMADGGEGTAAILCSTFPWQKHDVYYVNPRTRTAVIDSSAVIGLQVTVGKPRDILRASSAPLGVKVREIIRGGCDRVVIGIGGTATCDGGIGFLEGLGIDKLKLYKDRLLGLSDVRVPLVAPVGEPSALMFAPQKGATTIDMPVLKRRLESVQARFPQRTSPYDGAGGGLGFAIASVIGAPCCSGADYVLDHYNIKWDAITLVITGEGRIDSQTEQGKVVDAVRRAAISRNIPVIAIGGCVEDGYTCENVVSTADFHRDLPLNAATAALRLRAAVESLHPLIKSYENIE